MKIFVSHSGKDNEIVEKIDLILIRLDIVHWIDFKRITEGMPIPSEIEKGFSNCTHFFLVWSKDASESDWVKKEIDRAVADHEIKKIPLLVDNTKLPFGIVNLYHRISVENVEVDIKKLLNNIKADLDFPSQIKLFRETVCDHYEKIPQKPDNPIISNFRKFDGRKYYVQQSYQDFSTSKIGQHVGDYILQLIKQRLSNLDEIPKIRQQLKEKQTIITDLASKPEGRNYLSLINEYKMSSQIKRRVLTDLKIDQEMIKKLMLHEQLRHELSIEKTHVPRNRPKSIGYRNKIESLEHKISIIQTEFDSLKPEVGKKLQTAENKMIEIVEIFRLVRTIKSLENNLEHLSTENIIPIVGDYGSGKSALMHHLMYIVCEQGYEEYIPIFVPMGQLPHRDDSKDYLLTDIYEFVKKEYKFNLSDEEFRSKIADGKIILFLDALDEMSNKFDSKIAQTNLNHVVNLSKTCVTVLTSRHNYFSDAIENDLLITHTKLIKILDFSRDEIDTYMRLYIKNEQKIEEIRQTIEEGKLGDLPQKPLFLNVICEKFEELRQYVPINESVILHVLTDGWIRHDVESKFENLEVRAKITNERERISEILACKAYEKGLPIGIPEIMTEVELELGYEHSEARDRLSEYYNDAINSTFLVREKEEKYQFILNPVKEYFVAHRIVNDLKKNMILSFFKHVNIIKSPEVFDFIGGIIDIDWSVRPHVFAKLPEEVRTNDVLMSYKNLSDIVYNLINDVRGNKYPEKSGNLVKILYMSGNLPARPDLHGLDLTSLDMSNSNLKGANMKSGISNEINLRGSNLRESRLNGTKLIHAKLSGCDLTGADLTGADLSNVDLREANITDTNFTNASLRNANLSSVTAFKTKLNNTDLSFSTLAGADLSNAYSVNGAKFIGVDLQNTKLPTLLVNVNFRDSILVKLTLDRCDLSNSDLRDADLTYARLQMATIKNADLRWSKIINADLFKATLGGTKMYGADLSGTSLDDTDTSGAVWD